MAERIIAKCPQCGHIDWYDLHGMSNLVLCDACDRLFIVRDSATHRMRSRVFYLVACAACEKKRIESAADLVTKGACKCGETKYKVLERKADAYESGIETL